MYIAAQLIQQQQQVTPANMPDDQFFNWFVGLTSGEGCFYARMRTSKTGKPSINCEFKIALRADDKPLLDAIANRLGVGGVYSVKAPSIDDNPAEAYRVFKNGELYSVIIPIFEKFPLASKKQRDFDLWKQVVALSVTRMTPQKAQQAQLLVNKLTSIRDEFI